MGLINKLLFFSFLSFLAWSCGEEGNDSGAAPSEEDINEAAVIFEEAYSDMENIFSELEESDLTDLEAEMTLTYLQIEEALELDPNNLDANFSLGLMSFMLILSSNSFDDMLNQWEEYFDETTPFEYNPYNLFMGKSGFGLPTSAEKISVPIEPFILAPIRIMTMPSDYVPQFSELQDIIRTDILPYVDSGISALALIQENPDYVFTVSSAMQPDVGSSALEMDMTEVYIIDMMLHALKAICNTLIGHNFNFITHDANGILEELNLGSDFGTLNTNGGDDLLAAHNAMQNAITKLENAIDFLESETDDQGNDMIVQLDDPSEYQEVRDGLVEVRNAITQPTWLYFSTESEYYDYNYGYYYNEEDDSILVDIQQFYLNPFQDLKQLLPPYVVTTQNIVDWDYLESVDAYYNYSDQPLLYFEVDIEDVNEYSYFEYALEIDPYGNRNADDWYDNVVSIPQNVVEHVNHIADSLALIFPDNLVEAYLYWSCYEEYEDNCSNGDSYVRWYVYDAEFEDGFTAPVITWEANNFNDWKDGWPDPTFNGILPNWNVNDLLDFLGFDNGYDWEKTIDW